MKLTKKSTKTEVETTETVCEITKVEFEKLAAEVSAKTVVSFIGENPDMDDFMAGIAMTSIFAEFVTHLVSKMFGDNDTTENPDKKEEK